MNATTTTTLAHYLAAHFISPTNPITVNLIGAGGNGTQMLTGLARMNQAMNALDHPGLHVTVWDADTVSVANLGRQTFATAELGLAKSSALINRTNRFFGTNWQAQPRLYDADQLQALGMTGSANITISCVDTVSARFQIASILNQLPTDDSLRDRPYYWLDLGNSRTTGQAILATVGAIKQPTKAKYTAVASLPQITDEWADELSQVDDSSEPSCSVAEALTRQDLFINSTLAQMANSLLWGLFRNGMTTSRGFFLNLADFRTQPITIHS